MSNVTEYSYLSVVIVRLHNVKRKIQGSADCREEENVLGENWGHVKDSWWQGALA